MSIEQDAVLERAPYPTKDSATDRHGRPVLGKDLAVNPWMMATPLSDPWGGKPILNGRHQVKMHEPAPAADAPADGPFPNTSPDRRITVNFGFHRHSSVIDQVGALSSKGKVYAQNYVTERCRVIALAIDARAQHFPNEERYVYAPFAGQEDEHRYNDDTRQSILHNYDTRDIGI